MPKYVIERDIPQVGDVTADQVIAISQKSCSVLNGLGPRIQWLHSHVTQDKIIASTSLPTKRWGGSTLGKAASREPELASENDDRSELG